MQDADSQDLRGLRMGRERLEQAAAGNERRELSSVHHESIAKARIDIVRAEFRFHPRTARTRPATTRTPLGAARQIANADTTEQPMATQNASL